MTEFKRADLRKKPSPENLFTDVYDTMPKHIRQQYEELKEHVEKYPEHYPVGSFEKIKNV